MIKVGDSQSVSKTISESDVYAFAGVTGDFNGLHVDRVRAADSVFGERVAHGLLSAGLLSAVIGTKLPGSGTVYLRQTLDFLAPVKIGDTITARVTVMEILNAEKGIYKLKTVCVNQTGECVIDGEAVVLYREANEKEDGAG